MRTSWMTGASLLFAAGQAYDITQPMYSKLPVNEDTKNLIEKVLAEREAQNEQMTTELVSTEFRFQSEDLMDLQDESQWYQPNFFMEDLQTDFSHLAGADWAQFIGATSLGLLTTFSAVQSRPLLLPCGWQLWNSVQNGLYFYAFMAVYMDENFEDWRYMVPMTWLFTKFTDSIRMGECDGTPSNGFYTQLNGDPADLINYYLDFSTETNTAYFLDNQVTNYAMDFFAPAAQSNEAANAFVKLLLLIAIIAQMGWAGGQSYVAYYHYVNRFAVSEFFEAGTWLGRLIVWSFRGAYFTLLLFILGFTI